MMEFFNMGGYGAYVWGCYGISLCALGWLVIQPCREHCRLKKALRV